jgi:hypothetical protein
MLYDGVFRITVQVKCLSSPPPGSLVSTMAVYWRDHGIDGDCVKERGMSEDGRRFPGCQGTELEYEFMCVTA